MLLILSDLCSKLLSRRYAHSTGNQTPGWRHACGPSSSAAGESLPCLFCIRNPPTHCWVPLYMRGYEIGSLKISWSPLCPTYLVASVQFIASPFQIATLLSLFSFRFKNFKPFVSSLSLFHQSKLRKPKPLP